MRIKREEEYRIDDESYDKEKGLYMARVKKNKN